MLNNREIFLQLEPELFSYLSDYINEELTRGATIDKYTIHDAFEAFIGGASIEDTNEE